MASEIRRRRAEEIEWLHEMREFLATMRDAFREASDGLVNKIDSIDAYLMERGWKKP